MARSLGVSHPRRRVPGRHGPGAGAGPVHCHVCGPVVAGGDVGYGGWGGGQHLALLLLLRVLQHCCMVMGLLAVVVVRCSMCAGSWPFPGLLWEFDAHCFETQA